MSSGIYTVPSPALPEGWVWADVEELETIYAVPGAFDAFKGAVLERLRGNNR
jgi:hypothetical protein